MSSTAVPRGVSPREYLTEVEDVIKDRAYYADRVDWEAWEASVAEVVAGADDSSDTYPEAPEPPGATRPPQWVGAACSCPRPFSYAGSAS
jgi:hypothetical protein